MGAVEVEVEPRDLSKDVGVNVVVERDRRKRWNFEKFLIDKQGRPVKRYDAGTRVDEIIPDILALLN